MTQLAACGNRKQKQGLEKCDIDQNKQIVCFRAAAAALYFTQCNLELH